MNPFTRLLGTFGLNNPRLQPAQVAWNPWPTDEFGEEDPAWRCWQRLSPRQQEVTALICLGFTNRQVAARLHLSPETIKTHVHALLTRFDLPDRRALRFILAGWDFREWLD